MKKLLIGCGVIAVILVILGIGCTTYMYIKVTGMLKPVMEVAEGYEATNTSYAFTPPANDEFSEESFSTFVDIRETLYEDHWTDLQSLKDEFATLEQEQSFFAVWGKLEGFADTAGQIGNRHIELLEENKMSLHEYIYVAETMHATIYLAGERGAAELGDFQSIIDNALQESPEMQDMQQEINLYAQYQDMSDESLAHNAEIINKYKARLLEPENSLIVDYVIITGAQMVEEQAAAQAGGQ